MDLWEHFTSVDNLLLAMKNAAKGKMKQRKVKKFMRQSGKQKEQAALALRNALLSGTFSTSKYVVGHVYDHKPRTIYKLPFYPDRIVHHALMQSLQQTFLRKFISHSYAAVPGKGQHAAKDYAMLQVKKYEWCLQLDIKKFYPSIRHDILEVSLRHAVKDKRFWPVLHDIIWSIGGDCNLPIGNYTSQYFGNMLLTSLDNYILRSIKPSAYCRYCDDFLLFSNDKVFLDEVSATLPEWLKQNLHLCLSKNRLLRCAHGVEWLGYRLFKSYVLVRKKTAKRIKRKWPKLSKSQRESYKGHMQHACCYNLLQAISKPSFLYCHSSS